MKKSFLPIALLFFSLSLFAQEDPYLLKNIRNRDGVNCVTFSPDGSKILAGYSDGSARIYDVASEKEELKVEGHWKAVNAVAFDPKGRYFLTAGDNTIKIWSPEGKQIYNLKDHTTTIVSVDIDSTGEFMVSGAISKIFKQWNVLKGEVIRNFKGHDDVAMAVCFSRDGKRIASGSGDHTIKIWDASTGKELMSLPGHDSDIYDVEFSPDGKLLASCGKDKTIHIYDLETGQLSQTLKGHNQYVIDITFSPDGLHLLSSSLDQEIRLWEVATGKSIYVFIDHEAPVTHVAFSPDGKRFASGSQDKTIKIWRYSKEIVADYYYSPQIIEKMNSMDIFLPRQKGESGSEYKARQEKAEKVKTDLYEDYYNKYLDDLSGGNLSGS
ncbi:MAG TPA: WD40 repeat domain-containing protein [Bacteroidales bacterium]|nr:WD40 repeat domain-containing protein [Bacteroidales bacterium]